MSARLFADYLREIDKGRLHAELSGRFQELVEAVSQVGKAGSVTLKLSLKPASEMDGGVVTLSGEVKLTAPQPKRSATIFFVDEEFNLSRRDPRQGDIEDSLRGIDGGRAAPGADETAG